MARERYQTSFDAGLTQKLFIKRGLGEARVDEGEVLLVEFKIPWIKSLRTPELAKRSLRIKLIGEEYVGLAQS